MTKTHLLSFLLLLAVWCVRHACVRACVRVCVCACVRACVRACVCVCFSFNFLIPFGRSSGQPWIFRNALRWVTSRANSQTTLATIFTVSVSLIRKQRRKKKEERSTPSFDDSCGLTTPVCLAKSLQTLTLSLYKP